jgi:DNA repair protein RadC
MKKYILLIITALCLSQYVCGQSMSDQQLLKMAVQEKQAGASETEIAAKLMKNGATMEQIQRMRQQYATQISKRGLDNTVDNAIGDAQNRMRTNNEPLDN